jgi:NAD(P)H-dependent FMN reductase
MSQPAILAIAGSTRTESFNRKLLALAVRSGRIAGLDIDHVELADYPIPIFNEDLEAQHGQDPNATLLRHKLETSDGLMLACPEYNGSLTPLLKNVIDWVSRTEGGGAGVEVYRGKTALLIGASPGRLGATRAMKHLDAVLDGVGVHVMPKHFSVPHAAGAFDASDEFTAEESREQLERLTAAFAAFTMATRT